MNNQRNLAIYRLYAPLYDFAFRRVSAAGRRHAIELLNLQPGERVIIPGVGTGLDLPFLPLDLHITATDLSPAMLSKARAKARGREAAFAVMDAQALQFPDGSFDAVILNLILSVVPDGTAAFREAWRVLRPGGRAVIFDKFMPEQSRLSPFRQLLGGVIRALGTDPNRRLSEIIGGSSGLVVERDEASLLRGQYRIVLLRKGGNPECPVSMPALARAGS